MALQQKNWTLSSYTDSTPTDLVAEPALLATVVISNTTIGTISVKLDITDLANNVLASLLPPSNIGAGLSLVSDVRSFTVLAGQKIRVEAESAGINFYASGVIQIFPIAASGIISAALVGAPGLGQEHELTASSIASAPSVGAPVLL